MIPVEITGRLAYPATARQLHLGVGIALQELVAEGVTEIHGVQAARDITAGGDWIIKAKGTRP